MFSSETKIAGFNIESSKISTNPVENLKNRTSKEVFGNMMDIKTFANEKQREVVKQFLRNEFGDNYKFTESFVDKVIARMKEL